MKNNLDTPVAKQCRALYTKYRTRTYVRPIKSGPLTALYDHQTLHVSFLPFIIYTPSLAWCLRCHNVNRGEGGSNPGW